MKMDRLAHTHSNHTRLSETENQRESSQPLNEFNCICFAVGRPLFLCEPWCAFAWLKPVQYFACH